MNNKLSNSVKETPPRIAAAIKMRKRAACLSLKLASLRLKNLIAIKESAAYTAGRINTLPVTG